MIFSSRYINKETFDEVSFLEISKREQNSMDAFLILLTSENQKCVYTEMKWDGKLANPNGMLNTFK